MTSSTITTFPTAAPVRRPHGASPRAVSTRSAALVLAAGLLCGGTAFAADAPPQNVVQLQADSSIEVARDVLTITFAVTREGADAASVQAELKKAVDAALAEARSARAAEGQVDVRTGAFNLMPRYDPKGGKISGWQGTGEVVVSGKDMAAISALSGRIGTMVVSRVSTSLSREAREKVEADVTAAAIAKYQAKAGQIARQFGFSGYAIREVSVNTNDATPMMAVASFRAKAPMAADEAAVPVEAGKGTVTASVNGSVVMTR